MQNMLMLDEIISKPRKGTFAYSNPEAITAACIALYNGESVGVVVEKTGCPQATASRMLEKIKKHRTKFEPESARLDDALLIFDAGRAGVERE